MGLLDIIIHCPHWNMDHEFKIFTMNQGLTLSVRCMMVWKNKIWYFYYYILSSTYDHNDLRNVLIGGTRIILHGSLESGFFFLQLRKTSLLGHSYIKDRWLCVRQTDKNIYAIVALLASDFFLIMLTDLGEISCWIHVQIESRHFYMY